MAGFVACFCLPEVEWMEGCVVSPPADLVVEVHAWPTFGKVMDVLFWAAAALLAAVILWG